LLAKVIARRWGVPVVGAVRRVKATAPQAGLTNAKRRKNMSGAFTPSRRLFRNKLLERVLGGRFVFGSRKKLSGARVLLVDDVMTTGATAAACARALKRAGAKHVTLAAVARTDRRVALTDFEMAEAAVSRDVTEPAARDIKSRKTAGGTTT
jgi:predicted amidophosphoribosyltransferase